GQAAARGRHSRREKNQYSTPEIAMAAGRVSTQASAMLRTVASCSPEPFAAMVPATPDDSTCVVETGRPNTSATAMVADAVTSAAAPCAEVGWGLPILEPTGVA